jgi:hypothetical protein
VDSQDNSKSEPLYTVVCTDADPYAHWQCELLEHTWKAVDQPGELVRLVAADSDVPLPEHRFAQVIRTAPSNKHPVTRDYYVPYNRLYSFQEWLERDQPSGTVLVVDPDYVFRSAVDIRVAPGQAMAQRWVDFAYDGWWQERVEEVSSAPAELVQNITWGMLIHTEDLAKIITRWIELTALLRVTTDAWESDMVALIAASAELGVRYEPANLVAFMPWAEEEVAGAPIIHYCQPVEDAAGNEIWFKGEYDPWDPIGVDPDAAALPYCRDLLRIIQDYVVTRS